MRNTKARAKESNNMLRNPKKGDGGNDNASRIGIDNLKRFSWWRGAVLVMCFPLVVTAVFFGVFLPVQSFYYLLLKALCFFGGIAIALWQANRMEKFARKIVAPLHAALYVRFVFFGASLVYAYVCVRLSIDAANWLPVYIFPACLGVLTFSGFWLEFRPPEKEMSAIQKWLQDVARAAALFPELLLQSLWWLLRFLLTLLMCAKVCYSLKKNKENQRKAVGLPSSLADENADLIVLHLSDFHFMDPIAKTGLEGAQNNAGIRNFLKSINSEIERAHVVAITGDITDTGFLEEWRAANKILGCLKDAAEKGKVVIVPGNHDINVFATFALNTDPLKAKKYQKKLGLFGLTYFGNRQLRLVRYMFFIDRWMGHHAFVWTGKKLQSLNNFLASHHVALNNFADNSEYHSQTQSRVVTRTYDDIFPMIAKLPGNLVIYCLDSNARTWYPGANAFGYFGIRQLWRLNQLLIDRPENSDSIFLLHHHLVPGFRSDAAESKVQIDLFQKSEDYFLLILNEFLFGLILKRRLGSKSAAILHGHTHYMRNYSYGVHRVLCAPSAGFGEASRDDKKCAALLHYFRRDKIEGLKLIKSTEL